MGALATETVVAEQRTRNEFDLVQPGRFQPLSGGASTAYVERLSGDRQRLQGVFMAESGSGVDLNRVSVMVAEYAAQTLHDGFGQRYLNMHHARRYDGKPSEVDFQINQMMIAGPSM